VSIHATLRVVSAAGIYVGAFGSPIVLAQPADYPAKPIRLIVPYAIGGNADIVARILSPKLSEALGQQIIVDNRPGASGNIGAELASRAPADGYTAVIGTNTHASNMSLFRKPPFDLIRDFAPVTLLGSTPLILVVKPTLPAKTVQELVGIAKAHPGKLNYASGGSGSSAHLATELLKNMAEVDIVHVTYKGAGVGMTDVISGQVDMMFSSVTSARPHLASGRLRAIGVTSSKRSKAAPQVPTIAESGFPGFEATLWNAVLVPAGTPGPIVARLHSTITHVMQSADVTQFLGRQGFEPQTGTPEQLTAFMKAEIAKWAKVIKASGARIE
jgi:tripartite-type tricarboxylate transporter receptor subunit TctC